MKIQINQDAVCGAIAIPKGDYWVSLRSEAGELLLAGHGKDIKIPATRRRASVKNRTTQVSFYSGGGKTWSLVVSTPKHGEWVAFVEYVASGAGAGSASTSGTSTPAASAK